MLRINKDGSIPTDNPVVTFSVQASGAAPLHYQWQRNSSNISGATAQSYSIASVAAGDNGARFRVIVSNDYGSATSNEAVLNGVRQPGAHRDDRPTGQRVDLSRRHDDQLFGNR
jgi:hypothetical protein